MARKLQRVNKGPASSLGTEQLDSAIIKHNQAIEEMKKLSRLLEFKRRLFYKDFHKQFVDRIPPAQFEHLMNVRQLFPCNLTTIMDFTGLSSAGASLFITKLTRTGVLVRREDPKDRRNMIIDASPEGKVLLDEIEEMLTGYVAGFFNEVVPEDITLIYEGCRAMLRELSRNTPAKINK